MIRFFSESYSCVQTVQKSENRFDRFINWFDRFRNRFDRFLNRMIRFLNRFDQFINRFDRFIKRSNRFRNRSNRFLNLLNQFVHHRYLGNYDSKYDGCIRKFEVKNYKKNACSWHTLHIFPIKSIKNCQNPHFLLLCFIFDQKNHWNVQMNIAF